MLDWMFFLPYSYGGTPISGNLHMTYITYISAHREYCTNLTRGITHPKDGCSWGYFHWHSYGNHLVKLG